MSDIIDFYPEDEAYAHDALAYDDIYEETPPPPPAAPVKAPRPHLTVVTPESHKEAVEATHAANPYGKVPHLDRIAKAAEMPLTSMGLGARLALHYRGHLAWVMDEGSGSGLWYSYDGKRWAPDPDGWAAERATRATIMSIVNEEADYVTENDPRVQEAAEALREVTSLSPVLQKPARERLELEAQAARSARVTFGEQCQNGQSHIKAATAAAKDLLTVPLRAFDTHPTWINTQNGTVDVRTLELRPHRATDYLTKISAVGYYPDAKHEDLDSMLEWLAENDEGLPLFMQRFLGMATTARHAKGFNYIHGPANSGKTALIAAVCRALGNVHGGDGYARILSPSVIAQGKNGDPESANSSLHSLMGCRLLFMDEAARGFGNSELIKKLSSGGDIPSRPLYGKQVIWQSQVKMILAGNGRMAMADNDEGINTRLIGTRLEKSLDPSRMDRMMEDRLREVPQQEAILAWLIRGGHDWLQHGATPEALMITEKQRAETLNYKASNDLLGDFWEENVHEVEEGEDYLPLTTDQWHLLFARYCRQHGMTRIPLNKNQIAERLTARGYPAGNSSTRTYGGVMNKGKFRRGIASTMTPDELMLSGLPHLKMATTKPVRHKF